MDWMPLIGRRRPVEQDALRILVVVGQLGEPKGTGPRVFFRGEPQLQTADHLVRHPATLALLSIAAFGSRPEPESRHGAAEAVRRALATLPTPTDTETRFPTLHAAEPFVWNRLDDALALLASRDLLTVQPEIHPSGETILVYRLESGGARLLGTRSVRENPALARVRTCCRSLREASLPMDSGGVPRPWIPDDLDSLDTQLRAFRWDEQLDFDEDLLARFFQSTFGEPL